MPRDPLLVAQIVDTIARILELVAACDSDDLTIDRDRSDALLWNFTVLGEACNQVSDELKAKHPEVPWADPVRLRNRIVHGYWSVDLDVLISTARGDLPAMLRSVNGVNEAFDV